MPVTDSDGAFSCSIRADWLGAEAVPFGSQLNHTFTVAEGERELIEVQALFAPSAYRIDAAAEGRERREISAIARETGELLWLDHHLRLFARVDPERLPPKRLKASMRVLAAPAMASGRERDELLASTELPGLEEAQVVRCTVLDGPTRSTWTHFLVCDPARRASPSVLAQLLNVLLGERESQELAGFPWDRVQELVSKAGLPVAGGMRLGKRRFDPDRGSTFRLDGIADEPAPDERLDVPAGYGSAFDFDFGGLDHAEHWQVRYDDPRDPHPTVPVPTTPTPPPAGQAAVIGFWIPQSGLNAIRQTFNQAVRPLNGFSVANGKVTFDWLTQLREHWLELRGGGGTLVYCALHDEPLPAAGDPTPPRCATFTGRGRLDDAALQAAEAMVTAGTLPASLVSGLPSGVATELATPGITWATLSAGARSRIACEVLWQLMGTFEFPLNPDAARPTDPLVIDSPVATVTIDQVSGRLDLPPVERTSTAPVIESRPVIRNLYCRNDAYVVAELQLGTVRLDGRCAVTPKGEFWAGVAIAQLAAVFFPPLAALSAHAAFVGIELLTDGSNSVSLNLVDGKVFCYMTCRQDPRGMFGPDLTFSVSGELGVFFAPVSVTSLVGLFEILQEALRGWYSGLAMAALGQALADEVQLRLKALFGSGFPNAVAKLGIPISGGTAKGAAMDHVYFEVELGTTASSPPRHPIPVNPYQAMRTDVSAFATTSNSLRERHGVHGLSLNLSENAMNEILAARLATGFAPPLVGPLNSPQDLAALAAIAQAPAQPSHFVFAYFEAASPPAVTLLSGGSGYARADVDMRFTALSDNPIGGGALSGVTWRFRVSTPAQIAIGSARPPTGQPATPIIDFRQFPEHIAELLLDLNGGSVTLLGIEVQTPAGPLQSVPITPAVAAQHQPFLRAALRLACALHGFQREPRRDGIGGPSGGRIDLPLEQTYTPDGSDPDGSGGAPGVEFPVALGLSPGLLHMHAQVGGTLTALLDGTLPLGAATSTCAFGRQFLLP